VGAAAVAEGAAGAADRAVTAGTGIFMAATPTDTRGGMTMVRSSSMTTKSILR